MLSRPDGERQLTDLRHVAGALHTHQRRTRCGVTGLLDWLDDEIDRTPTREDEKKAARAHAKQIRKGRRGERRGRGEK